MDKAYTSYRNRSISQLVGQLNSLGRTDLQMSRCLMLALSTGISKSLRRTKAEPDGQMVSIQGQGRKYRYERVVKSLDCSEISKILEPQKQGFNVAIISVFNQSRQDELLSLLAQQLPSFAVKVIDYRKNVCYDAIQQRRIALKEGLQLDQSYQIKNVQDLIYRLVVSPQEEADTLRLVKITSVGGEIRLILFPSCIAYQTVTNKSLQNIWTQLKQILSYLKANPTRRFQNLSKLLPKRHFFVSLICGFLLEDSSNVCLNWIDDIPAEALGQSLYFYDSFSGIPNLTRKDTQNKPKIINWPQISASNPKNYSPHRSLHKDSSTKATLPRFPNVNQTTFARSLERKTHKYHLPANIKGMQIERKHHDNQEAMIGPHVYNQVLSEGEAIIVLKAQHEVQISQYKSTIQNLNQKLLSITQAKGLSQIYSIHEREIMLLELKIKELRTDIASLVANASSDDLSALVVKLSNQLNRLTEATQPQRSAVGKFKTTEYQLAKVKEQLVKSQNARIALCDQLAALTKRLRIKDQQTETLIHDQARSSKLSIREQSRLAELEKIFEGLSGQSMATVMILRSKFIGLLEQLGQMRQSLLYCNDFLLHLQDHIESRLGELFPEVVCDCNRFVRSFMLDNLSVLD